MIRKCICWLLLLLDFSSSSFFQQTLSHNISNYAPVFFFTNHILDNHLKYFKFLKYLLILFYLIGLTKKRLLNFLKNIHKHTDTCPCVYNLLLYILFLNCLFTFFTVYLTLFCIQALYYFSTTFFLHTLFSILLIFT